MTIDWKLLRVELSAQVVLREGLLELLACSPHTREHESVLAVAARPWHVYQALGLIGLQAGRPAGFDESTQRRLPPSGDRLVIEVRCADRGCDRTVNVWEWMAGPDGEVPLSPREWVFCGSRTYPGGAFGADADGTVICVVDFETALISVPQSHSADNALLWVAARTKNIPPLGTRCTLLIRAARTDSVHLTYDAAGRYGLTGRRVGPEELAAELRPRLEGNPSLIVTLERLPGVGADAIRHAVEALGAMGFSRIDLLGPSRESARPSSRPAPPG